MICIKTKCPTHFCIGHVHRLACPWSALVCWVVSSTASHFVASKRLMPQSQSVHGRGTQPWTASLTAVSDLSRPFLWVGVQINSHSLFISNSSCSIFFHSSCSSAPIAETADGCVGFSESCSFFKPLPYPKILSLT